jgi:hypothetical protein
MKGADIAAGAEVPARAGDQDGAHVVGLVHGHDRIVEVAEQFHRHAVGCVGPVQPDMGDAVLNGQQDIPLGDGCAVGVHWDLRAQIRKERV